MPKIHGMKYSKKVSHTEFAIRAAHPHGAGEKRICLRHLSLLLVAAILLSLAACANQSAVSPASEPLSVTNNPGAVGR
jgi:hypothetical protein